MAVVPSNDPKAVLYLAIDNPKNTALLSSYTTTPIARRILLDIIDALDIEKQPNGLEKAKEWTDKELKEVPDVIGKNVNEVKTVDANYLTTDIIDGVWIEYLPNLTDGNSMFEYCSNLKSFSSDLSSLTSGDDMFYGCPLTSFSPDLPSLTNGRYMFYYCSKLKSFSSDLSSLTDGRQMFWKCENLTTFNSDLSNLRKGSMMFQDCKLNAASVERILTSIPTPDNNEDKSDSEMYNLQLDIGSSAASKFAEMTGTTPTTSPKTISYKGWRITTKIYY